MIKNKLFLVLTFSIASISCSDKEISDISTISTCISQQSSENSFANLRRVPRIPSSESNVSLQEEVEEYFQKVVAPTIQMVESDSDAF
jgi:hypothetical protein